MKIRGTKEYPTDDDEQQSNESLKNRGKPAQKRLAYLIQDEKHAVVSPPKNESPGSPVPQAADQHRQHEIPIGSSRALSAPAERNIKIITQPG